MEQARYFDQARAFDFEQDEHCTVGIGEARQDALEQLAQALVDQELFGIWIR